MNNNEKEFIKRVNIDKAKNKTIICILLTIISLLTYAIPLLLGAYDIGLFLELFTLILIFIARANMTKYNEENSQKYIILAMIPIGFLLIYDFATIFSTVSDTTDLTFLGFDFILSGGLTILTIVFLFMINKDLKKAENSEKHKESTDWFYERLDEKDK